MQQSGCRLFVVATLLMTVGCPNPQPAAPPIDPRLDGVVMPGPWLRFARNPQPADVYEVLPSTSVILLMASRYDFNTLSVTINYLSDGSSTALEGVARDAVDRKRALDAQGFFELVFDNFRYSLIVTPRANERAGQGFDLVIVNRSASGMKSGQLAVRVRPRPARTLPSDVFFDCGGDFDAFEGRYHRNCKNSDSIIAREVTLQGWLIDPNRNCLGGLCVEDWHLDFIPDVDFIDSMYGRGGTVAAINGNNAAMESVTTKGNPPDTRLPGLPILDVAPDGRQRGVTVNSFALPGNQRDGRLSVVAELNAWHPAAQGGLFSRHWWGRGTAPAGWITRVVSADDPERAAEANAFWPFDPATPDGRSGALVGGLPGTPEAYVRVTGTLWQDSPHDGAGPPTASGAPWSFLDARKGAWIEIHPVDWLERLPNARPVVKTPWMAELISSVDGGETRTFEFDSPRPAGSDLSLRCRELIDGRLTDTSSVTSHSVTMKQESVMVSVTVNRRLGEEVPGNPPLRKIIPGRFKAAYLVWWESGPAVTGCRSE